MSRIAACYFCGTALEAPEPVRPAGEEGPALDLCADCEAKLAPVVEAVAAGAGTEAAEADGESTATADDVATVGDSTTGGGDAADRAEPAATGEPAGDLTADVGAEERGDGAAGDRAAAGDDAETDDGEAVPETDSADGLEARGVSPADYKRVLRLLQNRQFPVERAEIEAVLTSAYEFSPETVEAVLDAAVDRGVVTTDEEGNLVPPE